jgi:hypothetical protein
MTDSLKKSLSDALDEAQWSWLKPHAQRDALILVAPELDIVEVGMMVAQDQAKEVERRVQAGQISKPTLDQIAEWDLVPTTSFKCLIVQPFILMQPLLPVTLH